MDCQYKIQQELILKNIKKNPINEILIEMNENLDKLIEKFLNLSIRYTEDKYKSKCIEIIWEDLRDIKSFMKMLKFYEDNKDDFLNEKSLNSKGSD